MGHLVIDNKSSNNHQNEVLHCCSSLPTPPHSLLTSREVVPSCAEDHLLPLDTSSPLLTVNTTSHPVLQSPSEMSPLPKLNLLNKCSTLYNKSHMNNTARPTNKTTS